jgi:hypothetical protein
MKRNGQLVDAEYDKVAKLVETSRDYTMRNAKYEPTKL